MEQYGFPHSNGEHILKDFRQFLILQTAKKNGAANTAPLVFKLYSHYSANQHPAFRIDGIAFCFVTH